MIKTFKSKDLESFLRAGISRGIPSDLQKRLRLRLEAIDSASLIEDVRLPGYNLHELRGDREGTWSIKVSGNWRITFKFEDGHAYDVALEDYH